MFLFSLQALLLHDNELKTLSVRPSAMASLRVLDLHGNSLHELPEEIGTLTHLQVHGSTVGSSLGILPSDVALVVA